MKTNHCNFKGVLAGAGAALLTGLVLLATSCTPKTKPHKIDPSVLAKVGPVEIRIDDLTERLARIPGRSKEDVLQDMIQSEAAMQRALALGLDQDPEVKRAYRNLLVGRLKERELSPRIERVEVTQEEIQKDYDRNLARYTRAARSRVAMLRLKTEPRMREDKEAALRTRLDEARLLALKLPATERGFGTLSISYSDDQSARYKGGDIGWIEMPRATSSIHPQAVIVAVSELVNPGNLTEVIRTPEGVYLAKLIERQGVEVSPMARHEAGIRQHLLIRKRQQTETAFAEELRKAVEIRVYPEALAALPSTIVLNSQPQAQQPPHFP